MRKLLITFLTFTSVAVLALVPASEVFAGTLTSKPAPGTALDGTNDIRNGLVHFWSFQEGTGTTSSEIVGVHNMTLGSGVSWITGKDGVSKAISLSGASGGEVSSVTQWGLNSSDQNVVSVCAMIYPNSTVGRQTIYYPFSATGTMMGFEINTNNLNGSLGVISPGLFVAYTNTNAISAGAWQLVCYTRTGTGPTNAFYVNGVSKALNINGTNTFAGGTITQGIGARGVGSQDFNGKIEWVGYWNRALSSTEIANINTNTIYQVFVSGSSSAPVRHRVVNQ